MLTGWVNEIFFQTLLALVLPPFCGNLKRPLHYYLAHSSHTIFARRSCRWRLGSLAALRAGHATTRYLFTAAARLFHAPHFHRVEKSGGDPQRARISHLSYRASQAHLEGRGVPLRAH